MIELSDVLAAEKRLAPRLRPTPFLHTRVLSDLTGAHVLVKFENHQFTASFKERGALNKLLTLGDDERRRGVSAMSAGNHAQGVAYHARQLGIPATIIMPAITPSVKVEHTRAHGATVVLAGETLAEANEEAARITAAEGLTFIHPYDDPEVMAGQGTVALEMLAACPDLDVIVTPIGGGGLISGVATAAKGLNPGIEIIGVQAACYPSIAVRTARGTPPTGHGNTHRRGHRGQVSGPAHQRGGPGPGSTRCCWWRRPSSNTPWPCTCLSRRPWPREPARRRWRRCWPTRSVSGAARSA